MNTRSIPGKDFIDARESWCTSSTYKDCAECKKQGFPSAQPSLTRRPANSWVCDDQRIPAQGITYTSRQGSRQKWKNHRGEVVQQQRLQVVQQDVRHGPGSVIYQDGSTALYWFKCRQKVYWLLGPRNPSFVFKSQIIQPTKQPVHRLKASSSIVLEIGVSDQARLLHRTP